MPLPTGTVTFLFTDLEGSTALLRNLGAGYADVLAQSQSLARAVFAKHGGCEFGTAGDSFFVAFSRATDAVAAALSMQKAFRRGPWPAGVHVSVRMGLHTGEPMITESGYVGMDVHRAARISAAAQGGQVLISEATRQLVGSGSDLSVEFRDIGKHRLKDLSEAEHLFQLVAPGLEDDNRPLRTLESTSNNLPAELSTFIGRDEQISRLKDLLASSRLLSLTGVGGAGKTRLALRVAANVLDRFADGIWLIELAALSDPSLVPQAIGAALGLIEQPGRAPEERLINHLRSRSALLVVDNCEHLLRDCARLISNLLHGTTSLRIMATSRQSLGVAGEVVFQVPPLHTPALNAMLSPEDVTHHEAPRLFFDRAFSVQPAFAPTPANVPWVLQICSKLDGLPLAIELAAALTNVLSVSQICSRLDDRFKLLRVQGQGALTRHQTLRAVVDWSYELLSNEERVVLRRVSVFAGYWTLDAAEDICSQEPIERDAILQLVAQLVQKSLIIANTTDTDTRYALLETVRQYGAFRLKEAAETEALRNSHLHYYLKLCEEAEAKLQGRETVAWSDRLDAEYDNVRLALQWAIDGGQHASGLQLAAALTYFWRTRGYANEGARWFDVFLAGTVDGVYPARARAYFGAGWLAWWKGDAAVATEFTEQALKMFRALGDKWGAARSLQELGYHCFARGEFARAASLADESLALGRELLDPYVIGYSLFIQATLAERLGDDSSRVSALFQKCIEIRREAGHLFGIAASLRGLARAKVSCGEHNAASKLYEESLIVACDLADLSAVAPTLEGLALVKALTGKPRLAAKLLGAAENLRERIGVPPLAFERESYVRGTRLVSESLQEGDFQLLRTQGRALTLAEIVDLTLRSQPAELP